MLQWGVGGVGLPIFLTLAGEPTTLKISQFYHGIKRISIFFLFLRTDRHTQTDRVKD